MSIIHEILNEYWGYDSFRPCQEDIITSVLNGNDTLGLLPTGGGKSITFQVPAVVLDGLTIVVTPLISLMKDQVDNLRQYGIKATYLHSGLTKSEHRLAIDRCRLGKVKLLYLSPEKLQSKSLIDQIRLMDIKLIVVDEAHCISQWGYDFRPSYLNIKEIRKIFPFAPILALTASATPDVVKDIMEKLEFRQQNIFSRSFSRDNLSYIVRDGEYKEGQLIKILKSTSGSAIVYVRSRRRTREIAEVLYKEGISADFYHAGLVAEDKNEKQNKWKSDQTRVMVATNAFGMGIDKPNVRTVIHYDLPSSLEEYYQEAGRAGRDGKPAYAVLLTAKYDKATLSRRISEKFPDKDFIKRVYELLGNFLEVAVGSGYGQIYEFNFNLFCKRFDLPPITTHSALTILSQAQYIDFIEEINTGSRVMILLSKEELYTLKLEPEVDKVFQLLLRSYTGLFADYVFINESLLAHRLNCSEQEIYTALLTLTRLHAIHYVPRKTTPYILYTTSRELPKYIQFPTEIYELQRDKLIQRIDAMKRFAFSYDESRVNSMLEYFGEKPTQSCGKCDYCREVNKLKPSKSKLSQLRESIIYMASQQGGHELSYFISTANATQQETLDMIRTLLDEGIIEISPENIICLKG